MAGSMMYANGGDQEVKNEEVGDLGVLPVNGSSLLPDGSRTIHGANRMWWSIQNSCSAVFIDDQDQRVGRCNFPMAGLLMYFSPWSLIQEVKNKETCGFGVLSVTGSSLLPDESRTIHGVY